MNLFGRWKKEKTDNLLHTKPVEEKNCCFVDGEQLTKRLAYLLYCINYEMDKKTASWI